MHPRTQEMCSDRKKRTTLAWNPYPLTLHIWRSSIHVKAFIILFFFFFCYANDDFNKIALLENSVFSLKLNFYQCLLSNARKQQAKPLSWGICPPSNRFVFEAVGRSNNLFMLDLVTHVGRMYLCRFNISMVDLIHQFMVKVFLICTMEPTANNVKNG